MDKRRKSFGYHERNPKHACFFHRLRLIEDVERNGSTEFLIAASLSAFLSVYDGFVLSAYKQSAASSSLACVLGSQHIINFAVVMRDLIDFGG